MPVKLYAPAFVLDEAELLLVMRALESYRKEVAQVAPAQLRPATNLRAEIVSYLAELADQRQRAATIGGGQAVSARRMVPKGMGGSQEPDLFTVADAARFLGVSKSFVRRMAPQWGGEQVGSRWYIPRPVVEREQRRRTEHGSCR